MEVKLSKYQQEIIDKLKDGYAIHTTEGSDYSAWLVDKQCNKKSIRIDTVNLLFLKGLIKEGIHTMKYIVYIIK